MARKKKVGKSKVDPVNITIDPSSVAAAVARRSALPSYATKLAGYRADQLLRSQLKKGGQSSGTDQE